MQDLEEISQELETQGLSIFKTLHDDTALRNAVYPLSHEMLIKEFNKPSQLDNIPPVSIKEKAHMRQILKPGDVILCGNNGSFVHSMLYIGQGQVVHSLATQPGSGQRLWGVVREALDTYFARGERDTFVVLRPREIKGIENAVQYAQDQQGKPYDSLFLLNLADRFYYCTELVYHALKRLSQPPRVFPHRVRFGWQNVTVEDFMDSPDFQTVWERNFTRPAVGRLHQY